MNQILPAAATIAATITQNVADMTANHIDWDEFSRRQRAAWHLVTDRQGVRDAVLDILDGPRALL
jgi:hypothetical protein